MQRVQFGGIRDFEIVRIWGAGILPPTQNELGFVVGTGMGQSAGRMPALQVELGFMEGTGRDA